MNIIGGADGPTVIFVTSSPYTIAAIGILCVAVTGVIIWAIRNMPKKK